MGEDPSNAKKNIFLYIYIIQDRYNKHQDGREGSDDGGGRNQPAD